MSKRYNIETRNSDGTYFRDGDWGIDAARVSADRAGNFTDICPPEEAFHGVPCDFVDGAWVLDADAALEYSRKLALREAYTDDEFKEAIFEYLMEDRTDKLTALQAKRASIKEAIQ